MSNIFRADRRRLMRRKTLIVNLNLTAQDAAILESMPAKYRARVMTVFDASTSLGASAATLGLYTGAGATGSELVTPATLTALTAATKCVNMTVVTADYQTAATLYLYVGTAHGSAATVSVVVEIEDLS